jgi:prevent-host-death family protein
MRVVGIKQLRDRLSEYVRLAEAGEVVLVTDRDRPVARLTPATEADRKLAEHPFAELIRQGLVAPARTPPGTVRPPRFPCMSLEQILQDLDEDRADRW